MYLLNVFVWALFPILFLYTQNLHITPLEVIWAPLIISLAAATALLAVMVFLFRDRCRAGIFMTIFLGIFFSFGLVYSFLYRLTGLAAPVLTLLPLIVLSFVFYGFKKGPGQSLQGVHLFLFMTGLVLLGFQMATITWYNTAGSSNLQETSEEELNLLAPDIDKGPDVFYLLVDGYGGADILEEIYGFNNEPFLEELQARGFFIADKSNSNYAQTILSLSSTLNLDYLQNIGDTREDSKDRRHFIESIKNNRVLELFQSQGYHTISFFSPYSPANIRDVDDFRKEPFYNPDEFFHSLLNSTWLSLLTKEMQYDLYRQAVLFTLDNFSQNLHQEKPNFVYAHVVPPHPPFVFDREGEPRAVGYQFSLKDGSHYPGTRDDYLKGYIEQIKFLNKKIVALVEQIHKKSDNPIIIIQADHGPALELDWEDPEKTNQEERMSILNAIYFFDENYDKLYDTITPVNTFRVIFNQYFQADLAMLADKSFFSAWETPFLLKPAEIPY